MPDTWLAVAEQLADDARGLGFAAAETVASAWCARCDPGATCSLISAAYALTAGESQQRISDKVPPYPSAPAFLGDAEELEAEAAVLGKRGRDMAMACEDTRDRAIAEYEAARKQLAHLQRIAPATEEARREIQAQIAEVRARMAELEQVIGDCEAALDLLGQALERLDYALGCFVRVPDDFAETYHVPLEHVRSGGTLPWSGDFLTGANPVYPAETATEAA